MFQQRISVLRCAVTGRFSAACSRCKAGRWSQREVLYRRGVIRPVQDHRPGSEDRRGKTTLKKLIIFDLDGTLAESKSSLDAEMSALLHRLLEIAKVAVISGGDWLQFEGVGTQMVQ